MRLARDNEGTMARQPYDLLSIGDATIDVFLKIHDATLQCSLNRRQCVICFRYADKIPVEDVQNVPAAGNAANNAVGSARLGLKVALVTMLGDDEDGHRIAAELRRNRVGMEYLSFDRGHRTNYSVVLNYRGERTILVYHVPRVYRLPHLLPARLVYLTSMGKEWGRIVPAFRRYVRRHRVRVAFNPGTHQLTSSPAGLKAVLALTDILLVNREEAAIILRASPNASLRSLLQGLRKRGPSTVVITDGPRGSYAYAEGKLWSMPPSPVSVVENTGAGDAFSTGFLAALFSGRDVPEALRWGTVNAGSVIQFVGPQAGLLRLRGLRRLLRRYPKLAARPL